MTLQLLDFMPAMPEIVLLVMVCVTILAELFLSKRIPSVSYLLAQLTLVLLFVLSCFQCGEFRTVAFHGLFVSDDISVVLKLFIYIAAFLSFFYSRTYLKDRDIPKGDFYILGLLSVLGMMVLVSAHTLLTVYLGIELMSLPLYAMIALKRNDTIATEASLKYFIMGAVASGMMLYGMSMIYGATGSLNLADIATRAATIWSSQALLFSFSVVFLVLGISFKLAVVPFHMWAPDVYEGAPTAVTIFLSSAPKLAALGMAFRLLALGLPFMHQKWQPLIIIVSVLSVVIGNVFAIYQNNLKRLFAYSGISHMGYVLMGFLAGSQDGYSASLFYMLAYSLMAVASFGLLLLMSKLGFEAVEISHLKGLNQRSPLLAGMMLLVLLSMAGVPPLVGFFAKLLIIKSLVDAGLISLAILAMLFAVVGGFYYLRIIKTMYFEAPAETLDVSYVQKPLQVMFSLNALSLLVLGLIPNALVALCLQAFAN
jgi:NADH-quinone oxidoreductase subunit N